MSGPRTGAPAGRPLAEVTDALDRFFRYAEFPDFIVDLLAQFDPAAASRFGEGYLGKRTGLMAENGAAVGEVLCASFPSDDLLHALRARDARDALLVVKHPMEWEELGAGFVPASGALLRELAERRVSLYCAHAAHDNHPEVSPSRALARALPVEVTGELRDERGRAYGVVAEAARPWTFDEGRQILRRALGVRGMQERRAHDRSRRMAVIAGGGDNPGWLARAAEAGCDTYVTGILRFQGSDYAREHNPAFLRALAAAPLNAFGVSHYLSERAGSAALAGALGPELGLPAAHLPEESKHLHIQTHWGHEL